MPTAKKVIDIDALLAEHSEKARADRRYVTVKLFGREWRISDKINNFLALQAGDGRVEAFTQYLMTCTHEDEQRDFQEALYRADIMMDPDGLLMVINHLMEAVAKHPTKQSSGSSPSGRTRVAKPRSEGT